MAGGATSEPAGRSRAAERAWPLGVAAWVAGFWWFPDGWWHLVWLVIAVALPMAASVSGRRAAALLWADPAGRVAAAWAIWVAAATVANEVVVAVAAAGGGGDSGGAGGPPVPPWRWLPVLVLQYAGLVVLVAGVRGVAVAGCARRVLSWTAAAGAVAAAVSFAIWYGVEGEPFPRSRLRNVFVYEEGLHPVLTGLLAGFSTLAAAACAVAARSRARRLGWLAAQGVLAAAVFFSHSRGAILAAGAGFVVFAVLAGPRRTWPSLAVLAAVACFYQFGAAHLAPDDPRSPFARGAPSPAHELVGRRDSGRLDLYRELLGRIDSPREWIAGRGVVADRSAGVAEIRWDAPHPHSAYLGTLLVGGIVGLAALAATAGMAARRAWHALRTRLRAAGTTADDPDVAAWSALFAFGLVGLLFDGDNLLAIRTIPRLEALLFWVPWAVLTTLPVSAAAVRDGD